MEPSCERRLRNIFEKLSFYNLHLAHHLRPVVFTLEEIHPPDVAALQDEYLRCFYSGWFESSASGLSLVQHVQQRGVRYGALYYQSTPLQHTVPGQAKPHPS